MSQTMKTFNVLLVGAPCCGKTALAIRHLSNAFVKDYDETVEDVYVCSKDSSDITLRIIDTSGKSQSNISMLRKLVLDADAMVLTYDMTNTETWTQLNELISSLSIYHSYKSIPKVLVATKLDKETERQVSIAEGIDLSRQLSCPFYETSALTSFNVKDVFSNVTRQLKSSITEVKSKPIRSPKHLSRLVSRKFNYVVYKCKLSSVLY